MQKSRASFTVFFEDPFWVGVYEREEPAALRPAVWCLGRSRKTARSMSGCCKTGRSCTLAPRWRMSGGPGRKTRSVPGAWPGVPLPYKAWERRRSRRWALARGAGKQARAAARREQEQADRERRFALRVQRRKGKAQGR